MSPNSAHCRISSSIYAATNWIFQNSASIAFYRMTRCSRVATSRSFLFVPSVPNSAWFWPICWTHFSSTELTRTPCWNQNARIEQILLQLVVNFCNAPHHFHSPIFAAISTVISAKLSIPSKNAIHHTSKAFSENVEIFLWFSTYQKSLDPMRQAHWLSTENLYKCWR